MAILETKRGDVWWVALNPTTGSEMQKTRPAVIMSNDVANGILERVVIVPLTSTTSVVFPSECLVTLLTQTSKAVGSQIRTVSKLLLGKKIGTISSIEMAKIEQVVRLHLEL